MKLKNGSWKFEIGSQLGIKTQLCTSQCPPPAPCRSPRCHPQSLITEVFFRRSRFFILLLFYLVDAVFPLFMLYFEIKKLSLRCKI